MLEETQTAISKYFADNLTAKLGDASRQLGLSPIYIYNHLTRVRHVNKPYLTQEEYAIILEKDRGTATDEIAKIVRLKQEYVLDVLRKHGFQVDLINQDDEVSRIKAIIKKVYESDPYFPEKDLRMYLGPKTKPKDIRVALEAYKQEQKDAITLAKRRPEVAHNIAVNARRKALMAYTLRHPYATYQDLAKVFKVTPRTISEDIMAVCNDLRQQQMQTCELQRYRVGKEIEMIKDRALTRFDSSTSSSSRFLEIYLSALEKEAKLLGLNAPERKTITVEAAGQTKEERDAVVDAFFVSVDGEGKEKDADYHLIGYHDDANATTGA